MDATQSFTTPARPDIGEKTQEVHRIASELYRQQADWVTFFRRPNYANAAARRPAKPSRPA